MFDRSHHIHSTADMPTWYTGKPCHFTNRSHVDMCVFERPPGRPRKPTSSTTTPLVDAWGQERPPRLISALYHRNERKPPGEFEFLWRTGSIRDLTDSREHSPSCNLNGHVAHMVVKAQNREGLRQA